MGGGNKKFPRRRRGRLYSIVFKVLSHPIYLAYILTEITIDDRELSFVGSV